MYALRKHPVFTTDVWWWMLYFSQFQFWVAFLGIVIPTSKDECDEKYDSNHRQKNDRDTGYCAMRSKVKLIGRPDCVHGHQNYILTYYTYNTQPSRWYFIYWNFEGEVIIHNTLQGYAHTNPKQLFSTQYLVNKFTFFITVLYASLVALIN